MIRLHTLLSLDYMDITYSVTSALIWSMLEPSIGITLACIPVLKNLFPHIFRSRTGSKRSGETSGGTSRSGKKSNGSFQALEEFPLQPGGGAKVRDAENAALERSESAAVDGESVAESNREVRREGPLDRPASRQPGLKKNVVLTRGWGAQ